MKAMIISGFPGIGKTIFHREMFRTGDLRVSDSDSSRFSKSPNFPNNYIEHIKRSALVNDVVLVSSHKVVRDALNEHNIPFISVTPSIDCKEEYLQRYKDRGSPQEFVDLLDTNWTNWIEDINQTSTTRVELPKGTYLSDSLKDIMRKWYLSENVNGILEK